jgi:hypothetical protein
MSKHFVVRVVHGDANNTFRISGSAHPAMLDLLMKELRKGKIRAFSVEGGR